MEMIPMVTRLGTINHAKGFVINKLYEQRRFGGSHVPVRFLSQGYPPEWRHLVGQAVRELKTEGIIEIEPKRQVEGAETTRDSQETPLPEGGVS